MGVWQTKWRGILPYMPRILHKIQNKESKLWALCVLCAKCFYALIVHRTSHVSTTQVFPFLSVKSTFIVFFSLGAQKCFYCLSACKNGQAQDSEMRGSIFVKFELEKIVFVLTLTLAFHDISPWLLLRCANVVMHLGSNSCLSSHISISLPSSADPFSSWKNIQAAFTIFDDFSIFDDFPFSIIFPFDRLMKIIFDFVVRISIWLYTPLKFTSCWRI